jgi:hypothetical protein
VLKPDEIRKNISLKLCGYVYLASLYGIYPVPLFAREWRVTIRYNTRTRELIGYDEVDVLGDVAL